MPNLNLKNNIGYDFTNNKTVLYPSIRVWFNSAITSGGFVSPTSTYRFSDGFSGSAISQAFTDKHHQDLGVISIDIFGYNSLGKETNGDIMNYLLIAKTIVDNKDKIGIAYDLATTIYYKEGESDEQIDAKTNEISKTIRFSTYEDKFHHEHDVMQYEYEGDMKYVMFDDIELLRMRLDNTQQQGSPNKVAIIISSKIFRAEIDDKREEMMAKIVVVNGFVITWWLLITISISIIASRYLSDNIMDDIINLCIKMRIAQASHTKLKKMHSENKDIIFSSLSYT